MSNRLPRSTSSGGGTNPLFDQIVHHVLEGLKPAVAFAADSIIMDPHAALGPVDPQLGDAQGSYPVTSLLAVVAKKKIDKIDDKTYQSPDFDAAADKVEITVSSGAGNVSIITK